MLPENYLIFFTHIPKTGGTSFKKSVIEPNISRDKIYNFLGFRKLLFNNLKRFEFVDGHYPFGIHWFTWYTERECLYLVILREPLDHAISYYHFIKQCDFETYKHPKLSENKKYSLVEFYERKENRNLQTQMIAGFPFNRILPSNSEHLLSIAKYNLTQKYHIVGTLDKIESFEEQVASYFHWEYNSIYETTKITINRPKVTELKDSEKFALRKLLSLDIELYESVMENLR